MKVVHTSDWHAGRVWKNTSRLDELEAVLDHLARYVVDEQVDLLLVSGDVFDTSVPSAKAERAVFRFFRRVGAAGTKSVVIAGNHDSESRVEAWGTLAELAGVHAIGKPCDADSGGVVEVAGSTGERAVICALPFAAPRYLVSAIELAEGDASALQTYAERMRLAIAALCSRFRADAVNLLVAHTHLEGALWTGSERKVHLGDTWAALPQTLPSDAHYVALGHIHRPQEVASSPSPAFYAGSPLQLDFGEAGEDKSFVSIEAKPRKPARIRHVPYEGATPLAVVEAGLQEIERRAEELRKKGWLKVVVTLAAPDADVNRKVRAMVPNAVAVDVKLPVAAEGVEEVATLAEHAPKDVYRAYFRARHGREPDAALVELFEALEANAEAGA